MLPRLRIRPKPKAYNADVVIDVVIEEDRLVYVPPFFNKQPYMQQRASGPFGGCAVCLDTGYDWVLGVDEGGSTVLVPLKK